MPKNSYPDISLFRVQDILTQNKRDSWLRGTIRSLGAKIKTKFALGRIEHGGDIGSQTVDFLLDQMEQEAIDQLMYVRELKRRLVKPTVKQEEFPGQP